jgi:hypothetical protein
MSLREDFEFDGDGAAAEVQKAYDESGRYEFDDERLWPWTVRRHSVALQLRSRLMLAVNDENGCIDSFMKTGFYPHLYHDIVVVLFLLHLDNKEVIGLEELNYQTAMGKAYQWAESIKLDYGSKKFFDAGKILGKILHQIHVSWYQVAKEAKSEEIPDEKKSADTGQAGRSNSVSELRGPPDMMQPTL